MHQLVKLHSGQRTVFRPFLGILFMIALFFIVSISSCSVAPIVIERTNPQTGSITVVVSGGGSLLTKSKWEKAMVKRDQKTGEVVIEHEVVGKDETAVPRYGAQEAVGTSVVDQVVPGFNAITQ